MPSSGEDVYATLLLSDTYLPGALVLAHSLRDAGTTKKLAVLVTADAVSADAMVELQRLFDYIIPVERVVNQAPANLFLMNRADLHSTFTKIALWKQVQFRKIVYVDADMVALRAPDELFNLPQAFSAAPDIGWPDIFNTGLMVLTPNMGDYYALLAMAQRGISFDGADQGLLNMHFKNTFNRLSFTYNVTPSAHYQYLPAYKHFQSQISMAHFIGTNKPWTEGREANKGSTPYDEMVGRWWAVYDRHFRESSVEATPKGQATLVHYHTKGEFHPVVEQYEPETQQKTYEEYQHESQQESQPESQHESQHSQFQPESQPAAIQPEIQSPETEIPAVEEQRAPSPAPVQEPPREVFYSSWDASKAPPPADSRPEAYEFPSTHYEMSSDPTPFKAPERYPSPPKHMYYEVPKTPTYQKPAPIFPWETNAPKPTRIFPEDNPPPPQPAAESSPTAEPTSPVTPTTPIVSVTTADPWQTYTRGNAWDDIPEIERYIGALQKNRKGNIQILQGYQSGIDASSARRQSLKLTDFPTELERPSLPVTPAPIRRPSFWGEERDEAGELPSAQGVPAQEDWNPVEMLEKLARRQSEVLEAGGLPKPGEVPARGLPFGSEGVKSETGGAKEVSGSGSGSGSVSEVGKEAGKGKEELEKEQVLEQPSYQGPSAAWEKDETFPTRETAVSPSEEELDALS